MLIGLKLLIVVAVVGLLRSCQWFRNIGRELDEAVYASIKRIMRASEESGFPPYAGPLLIILTALIFALSLSAIRPFPFP
jgi:hypothetical protein